MEFGADDVRLPRHLPDAAEGESLDAAAERAQVGGEQLGDHVDAPVRQVDGGRAVGRFLQKGDLFVEFGGFVMGLHYSLHILAEFYGFQ